MFTDLFMISVYRVLGWITGALCDVEVTQKYLEIYGIGFVPRSVVDDVSRRGSAFREDAWA